MHNGMKNREAIKKHKAESTPALICIREALYCSTTHREMRALLLFRAQKHKILSEKGKTVTTQQIISQTKNGFSSLHHI